MNLQVTDKKHYCLFLVLSSLLCAVCLGQLNDASGRSASIMYFKALAGSPSEAFIYSGDKEVAKTPLPRSNFSKFFKIPKGDQLLSFLPKPMDRDRSFSQAPPSVKVPESWGKVLFLVFEDKSNAVMPIRVVPINASDNQFGPGCLYVINFSELRVFGTIGEKELKIRPMEKRVIKQPIDENGDYAVRLQALVQGDDKPRRFIKQMWSYNDKMRTLFLILPKPAPYHATYYSAPIRDF
ncbi:hypothetical protein [Rubritalea sp.]|uniref:hypothetical protein n=1 Tax=Rubritalea sp. TaxID=2109375 RepID=UPI003EF4C2BA